MDSELFAEVQHGTRNEIVQALWGDPRTMTQEKLRNLSSAPYWQYFHHKCVHALRDRDRHIALRKLRDIVEVTRQIKADTIRSEIKDSIRRKLTTTHANEDELLDKSVDLATSLLLMIDCGSLALGFSGKTEISWVDGCLREHLKDYFCEAPALAHTGVKLQKEFTARNLCRIAGMNVFWTDNLIDHLRLTEDDTRIHIFHHASLLEYQRHSRESLLPAGLVKETLQTLALLFPSSDVAMRKWVARMPEFADLDSCLIYWGQLSTDSRQIERFVFWRDRLVTLKQVFDEAQPKTLAQWWHDRRNVVQWYTFWVAVVVLSLTILFGLIQCIEGALQVYASLKSLQ
ncbi:hypothetical protein N0V82_003047 [Gnomoniopsis sp. IMI 355080]|nr:hypothetical protein N0V82_003047 [Gnomoniopsis sp. IMI 355080]